MGTLTMIERATAETSERARYAADPARYAADPARHAARGNQLFDPVRPGLEQVEARLRRVDPAARNGNTSVFAPLANAFLTLIGSGGKRLRPALALLAAELNPARSAQQGAPAYDQVVALAAAVEMLHTSTLVHDDVIDGALLRRGAPTLNAAWSGGATVLAGNFMFGAAAQLAAETENVRVIRTFADTLRVIVDGELRQLLDRFAFDQPKENYYQRIYAKTASLFCAATEGAAVLAGLPEVGIAALRNYGYNLGMAFQIVDDILDFTSDESTLGKPAGSDLLQGTLTLPFFHFVRSQPNPVAFVADLERAHEDAELTDPGLWPQTVDNVVQTLRAGPAVRAARDEAGNFLAQARADLDPFPDTIHRRALLGLCDFVIERTH